MEEDLKLLEEFIKYYEAEATSRKFRGTLSISVDEDDIEAIENLIKGYRELEETYDKLAKHFVENHISKSKIKEKLEELKEEYKIALEENSTKAFILKCQIEILEKLLEDK